MTQLTAQEMEDIKRNKRITTDQLTRLANDRGDDIETTKSIMSGKGYTIQGGSQSSGQQSGSFSYLSDGQTDPSTVGGGARSVVNQSGNPQSSRLDKLNPIGAISEGIDNLVQKIPTFTGQGMEDKLNQKLQNLSPEQRRDYQKRFDNSTTAQKLYGNVDNFIKEKEMSFGDRLLGVGDKGPSVGKMLINAPGSAVKTASAITRAVTNPLDTAMGIGSLVKNEYNAATDDSTKSLLKDRYITNLDKTMNEDPIGLASDALGLIQGGASLVKSSAGLAGRTGLLGQRGSAIASNIATKAGEVSHIAGGASSLGLQKPIASGLNALKGATGKGLLGNVSRYAGHVASPGLDTASSVIKMGGGMLGKSKNIVKGVTKGLLQQVGQLTDESMQFIKENPQGAKQIMDMANQDGISHVIETKTSKVHDAITKFTAEVSDEGRLYDKIKQSGIKVDTQSIKPSIDTVLKDNSISIQKGGILDFSESKFAPGSSDASNIQKAYDVSKSINGKIDVGIVHNKRMQMDSVIDKTQDYTNSKRVIDMMRGAIDTTVKDQVPIMKKLDQRFAPQRQLLQDLRDTFLDSNGRMKPSAYSKIYNAGNKTNIPIRKILQKLDPSILDDIKQIQFMNNIERQVSNTTGGGWKAILSQVVTKGSMGAGAGAVISNPILGALVGTGYALLSYPGNVAKMLIKYYSTPGLSKTIKNLVKSLEMKISEGGKIDHNDAMILGKVAEDVSSSPSKWAEEFSTMIDDAVNEYHKKQGDGGDGTTAPEGPTDTPTDPNTTPGQGGNSPLDQGGGLGSESSGIPIESYGQMTDQGVHSPQDILSPNNANGSNTNTANSIADGNTNSIANGSSSTRSINDPNQNGLDSGTAGSLQDASQGVKGDLGQNTVNDSVLPKNEGTHPSGYSQKRKDSILRGRDDGVVPDEKMLQEQSTVFENSINHILKQLQESEYTHYSDLGKADRLAEYYSIKNNISSNEINAPKKALESFDAFDEWYTKQESEVQRQANLEINLGNYQQNKEYKNIVKSAVELENKVYDRKIRDRAYDTAREKILDDIMQAYSIDQFEASNMYDTIINKESFDTLKTMNANLKASRGKMMGDGLLGKKRG